MIRAVTFDLDGVYFTEDSFQTFKANFPKNTTDQNLIDHVLSKSDEITQSKQEILTEDQYWNYVRSQLGVSTSNKEISKLLADSYQVNPNVVDIVKKTRNLGVKTCICTNNFPTRINALQDKFHFLDDFDVQIFSYQVNATKPDPKIFQALINQSDCQPNEIVFADDKEANVISAQSLGINAFIYQGFDHFLDKLRSFLLHL
ncbi:hypothetical protein A3K55_00040 [Candidatus Shapirobacteria bacterium RBG_13_44_7]|uniref:Haloacid dehalogenase n=1 Tax=Candidatus Shapirobacteria bacterium RBG_13_44_7 TaxID=1802149 RepID=A0A1F7SEP1_9BACT|nr:MAG: hypothetical protein A3K55_00040 [Candidatus Shapirobacteria bacterium RBG_13_44_7]